MRPRRPDWQLLRPLRNALALPISAPADASSPLFHALFLASSPPRLRPFAPEATRSA